MTTLTVIRAATHDSNWAWLGGVGSPISVEPMIKDVEAALDLMAT